jgi:FtsP/CotA-like multicopper oxidase with cupredoxin domain
MRHDPERRKFLEIAGGTGLGLAGGLLVPSSLRTGLGASAEERISSQPVNYTIRVAPVSHEIAPRKIIKTTAYNGSVPGSALRLREGRSVRVNVINDSGYPNLIHWHGLYLPSVQDGASEEGSPIIKPGDSLTYAYTPKPAGTRGITATLWRRRT